MLKTDEPRNVEIKYMIFGNIKKYNAFMQIESPQDFKKLMSQHTSSRYLTITPLSMPTVSIEVMKESNVQTFAYNKGNEIAAFLKNTSVAPVSFPIVVQEEPFDG